MKPKTKRQINEMARLMWNQETGDKAPIGTDFRVLSSVYWNMAIEAYVYLHFELTGKRCNDLLKFKI